MEAEMTSDNTWLHELLRGIQNRIEELDKKNDRQHAEQLRATNAIDRKVTAALTRVDNLEGWRDGHNEHHGPNDKEIGKRLDALEDDHHDRDTRRKRDLWWWGLIGGAFATGGTLVGIVAVIVGLL